MVPYSQICNLVDSLRFKFLLSQVEKIAPSNMPLDTA